MNEYKNIIRTRTNIGLNTYIHTYMHICNLLLVCYTICAHNLCENKNVFWSSRQDVNNMNEWNDEKWVYNTRVLSWTECMNDSCLMLTKTKTKKKQKKRFFSLKIFILIGYLTAETHINASHHCFDFVNVCFLYSTTNKRKSSRFFSRWAREKKTH